MLFTPVEIGGRLLVDGGIVDDVPVEQLRTMNADFTIVSDVSRKGKISKRPENIYEVMMATIYTMQARISAVDEDACDCYIRTDLSQYSSWGWGDAAKMIATGRKSAEAALPRLKQQLRIK